MTDVLIVGLAVLCAALALSVLRLHAQLEEAHRILRDKEPPPYSPVDAARSRFAAAVGRTGNPVQAIREAWPPVPEPPEEEDPEHEIYRLAMLSPALAAELEEAAGGRGASSKLTHAGWQEEDEELAELEDQQRRTIAERIRALSGEESA